METNIKRINDRGRARGPMSDALDKNGSNKIFNI